AEAVPPPEPLPPLDDSDALVRRLASTLSSHPQLLAWLAHDHLVRDFVAAVDDVARGQNPRSLLSFLAPEGAFRTERAGSEVHVDPRSYQRYDLLVDVFTSLDTAGVAELYRRLSPLFEQAYRDLGYPEGGFDARLAEAIATLRAVPRVEDPVLVEDVGSYKYADPALEGLSPAQKQLLRMGPANVLKVQEKLRLIGRAVGLAVEEP
ncbi:MAG: DUF3014 domain-containing protein, partial [Acidobacteria bacterium]